MGGGTLKAGTLLIWGIRLALSGLFLYSGWIKMIDPESFARSVAGYDVLNTGLIPAVTFIIPWLEFWCGVSLLAVSLLRKSASWILLLLLVGFTVLKVSAVLRGLDISCGCTGSEEPLGWGSVVQNLGWLFLTILHLRLEKRR